MKNRAFILFLVILIVTAWVVAGFWLFSFDDNDNLQSPSPDPTTNGEQNPNNNNDPSIDISPSPSFEPPESIESLNTRRNIMLEEVGLLFRGYFYEEALLLLDDDETLINDETHEFKNTINEAIENLVLYEGDIKHIFFHTLIVHPERIYRDLTTPSSTYAYFLYQRELVRILPQLLERDFVLFDANDVFRVASDGNMQRKDIYLPPGKKPLILSIDDPCYQNHTDSEASSIGFPRRVVLDSNGELAVEIKTPESEIVLSYDGDVFLLVDNFVLENPEFSWRGAKGIIAATGIGLFGFRNEELFPSRANWIAGNLTPTPEMITNRETVTAIADKIKSNGWLFANHSFTHNNVDGWWHNSNSNAANIRDLDIARWHYFLNPILGETNILISPGGARVHGASMQALIDAGYNLYFTVDTSQSIIGLGTPIIIMGRIEISWYSLVRFADILNRDFFNVASVIDSHRPPLSIG
ncbi:MAG: hypothetical protein LBC71_07300 [Oscillospiraceae bacterium]|jgi:hypothetical protein|nr:hypothetical protein [Oscillospiraceae bacterium]